MLDIIVTIRNFAIAVILAWVGVSFSAPDEATEAEPETEKSAEVETGIITA